MRSYQAGTLLAYYSHISMILTNAAGTACLRSLWSRRRQRSPTDPDLPTRTHMLTITMGCMHGTPLRVEKVRAPSWLATRSE